MVEIDQKYAGIPFGSYILTLEKFFTDRDSINKAKQRKDWKIMLHKSNYAYLFDRIRANKKKTIFWNSISYNKLGQSYTKIRIRDSINVDERKKKI